MSIGLKKNFAVFALSALAAGAVAIACGGGGEGGSNGGAGGDSGGAGGDGGGGGNGGAATGGKGSGGNGNGGSGNGGSGNGGSGGSSNGGSGGMPMTGGMGMGGAGGMLMTGALPWCNSTTAKPAVNDGVVEGLTGAGEPFDANAPVGEIRAIGSSMVFVPAQYAAAPDGKVGLVIVLPSYNLTDEKKRLEQAINAKHFPPVIVATSTRGSALALIDTLQGMFPKIPKDPKWVAVAGQSTAGAEAFDLVWDNPGKAANAITASGSFVCFMGSQQDQRDQNNAVYIQRIGAAAKKPIRASLSVGTCDIFGSLADRIASDCSDKTCDGGECVDKSACGANWQKVNRDVAGALQAKGYGYQLQIMTKGKHQTPVSPPFINQIRWVFKPIMCS